MSEQTLPLVFALKHLRIVYHDDELGSPAEFSQSARLLQGTREIPMANDAGIDRTLGDKSPGALPTGVELQILQMSCPGWPEDVVFAFEGITAFGAMDLNRAKACAKHALSNNRDCRLARQLVKLLSAKTDVRCPFGVNVTKAPDVPRILAAGL